MTTSNDHQEPFPQADTTGAASLPAKAQAAIAEIKTDNAALKFDEQIAEVQAEATEEQAKLLDQVTEEVLEELQERQQADPA
jgi:L-lactate utilization protein LutC